MTGQFLGGISVGDEIPGAVSVLNSMGAAIGEASSALGTIAAAINAAKAAIRPFMVGDLESQVANLKAIGVQIGLENPVTYLQELLNGLAEVEAGIAAIPPALAALDQINATVTIADQLIIKIGLAEVQLGALDSIVNAVLLLLQSLQVALRTYSVLITTLAATGAYSFLYQGQLASLGSGFDAVTPESGVSGVVPVTAIMLFVPDANQAASNALRATFKVA